MPVSVACAEDDARAVERAEMHTRAPPAAEFGRVVQREQQPLLALRPALLHQHVQRARALACKRTRE